MWQDKLTLAMRATGLRVNDVANQLGVHANTLRNYLKGNINGGTDPSPAMLWQMCRLFGVSSDWVLDDAQPARLVPATAPAQVDPGRVVVKAREVDSPARTAPQSRPPKKRRA